MTSRGAWRAAGRLASARIFAWHRPVTLTNGQVLVTGGMDANFTALPDAELYDEVTGKWSATAPMTVSRHNHSMTRLADGRVLVAGGDKDSASYPAVGLDSAELYDPAARSWSMTGPMRQGRTAHSATLLADGRVLVAGGLTLRASGSEALRSERALRSAELYDPASGRWVETGAMTEARWGPTAVLLHDGTVLVVGGCVPVGPGPEVGLSHCELYDPRTGSWAPTGSLTRNRMGHDAALLGDGRVLVMGGSPGYLDETITSSFKSTELYDPQSGQWAAGSDMHVGRWAHRALTLSSGQVLVVGGWDYSGETGVALDSAEIYDPAAGTWAIAGRVALGRRNFAAEALSGGRVLVAGGITATYTGHLVTGTAELFTSGGENMAQLTNSSRTVLKATYSRIQLPPPAHPEAPAGTGRPGTGTFDGTAPPALSGSGTGTAPPVPSGSGTGTAQPVQADVDIPRAFVAPPPAWPPWQDRPGREPTAFDKLNFARDLALSEGEVSVLAARVRELPDGVRRGLDLARTLGGGRAYSAAAASLAGQIPAADLVALAAQARDLRAECRQALAPALSSVRSTAMELGYAPPELDQPKALLAWAEERVPAAAQLVREAVRSPELKALEVSDLLASAATDDVAVSALIDRFEERRALEPVAWLHLERVEMTPVGLERGELVATIPMAPGEKVSVSHKEWSAQSSELTDIVTDSFETYSEQGVAEKSDVAMSNESETKRDNSLNFGVSATGSYGPVSMTTSMNLSSAQSERDARSTSTKDAIETTRKSSARVRKEHKVSLRVETRSGTEDIAAREIHNTSGNAIRIDYYRMMRKWQVDLIRYGLRMTYDLVVPDPGASLRAPVTKLAEIDEKLSSVFTFDDVPVTGLTRANWQEYARRYGVALDPPPPERLDPADLTFEFPALVPELEAERHRFQSWQFELPDGYLFRPEKFEINYADWRDPPLSFVTVYGDSPTETSKGRYSSQLVHLNGKSGHISIQYSHRNVSWAAFRLQYHLDLSPGAFAAWQSATWARLRDAAEQRYYTLQQSLRDTRARLQEEIDRDDTLTLRRAEREEIMKRTLQWLFGPAFDTGPASVKTVLDERALLDPSHLSATEDEWRAVREFGEFVKFLHQAVEWENVLYFLYPYFWGSQKLGDAKRFLWHPDSTRRAFLRAGAARVALPVRPGFEAEFAHLMETGSLGGGRTSPYVSLAEEMQFFARTNYAGVPPANPDVKARTRPLLSERQEQAWDDLQYLTRVVEAHAEAAKHAANPAWTGAPAEPEWYPTTEQGLAALGSGGKESLPLTDPWGRPYQYTSPGQTAPFVIWTFGADGQPGGEGEDADVSTDAEGNLIGSWFEYTPSSGLDIEVGTPASMLA